MGVDGGGGTGPPGGDGSRLPSGCVGAGLCACARKAVKLAAIATAIKIVNVLFILFCYLLEFLVLTLEAQYVAGGYFAMGCKPTLRLLRLRRRSLRCQRRGLIGQDVADAQ